MKTVYIIADYNAFEYEHWYLYISDHCKKLGIECHILNFSDHGRVSLKHWCELLEQKIPLHRDVVLIAHGAASAAVFTYLSTHLHFNHIHALVMIAPWIKPMPSLPELNNFISDMVLDSKVIHTRVKKLFLFFSNNHPYIQPSEFIQFGHRFNIQMFEKKDAGQFYRKDGYSQLIALLPILQAMAKVSA